MSKKTIGAIAFVSGVFVGMILGAQVVKDGYKDMADEEIASVKEAYARKYAPKSEDEEVDEALRARAAAEMARNKPDLATVAQDFGTSDHHVDYAAISHSGNNNPVDEPIDDGPVVISPDEVEDIEDYEVITLHYFNDGVLTDDNNILVDDVESCVGSESLNHFGEYEEDSVYVRNDRLRTYYEILLQPGSYEDLIRH